MKKYEKLSLIQFGQRHPKFTFEDFQTVQTLKRLYLKHHRICGYLCDGVGWIMGKKYTIDTKGYYVNKTKSVFDVEVEKLENTIRDMLPEKYSLNFQRDPRGNTVKLKYDDDLIHWELF